MGAFDSQMHWDLQQGSRLLRTPGNALFEFSEVELSAPPLHSGNLAWSTCI